jgi:hypothetical protein
MVLILIIGGWLTLGFSKTELRLTIPFELPPVLFGGGENSDAASDKTI